ncbi:unnamed protein product [Calicophoron daubneyi]|uniref:Sec39 domain-containing protein n=1 Tax=Calicophoron daubneyi TaxID=300641 RepID=A0AAV2TCK1_CALDB
MTKNDSGHLLMSTTSTRGSFLEFPCVSDEIARWTCTFEANSWLNDEDTVAASLFRCFMLSSRHGQFKSSAQSDASELPQSNLSSLASTLFQPFVYGWQSLTSAVRIWRTSTSLFNAYARLHTHDCPWQLGYLSSGSMCWENLYVVTSRSIELIKIPCKAAQKVMSEQDYETEDEKSLSVLTELISENPRQSTDGASMNDVSTASSPIHQRWKLSYLDPWPQWRQICFSPVEDGNEGSLFKSRSAAIGYSNGSVELIQVASSEEDSADSNDSSCRKRIFVPAPSTPKSGDQRDSLLPIVFLHFIDLNHLIICHFRGHVDLWHLNWNAERYPARMMARIYPFTYIPSSSHILPLTAGAYDAVSQILVISGLPTATSHRGTTHLHESLELSCFQVSPDPPFLTYLDPRSSTNSANRGGIMAALTKARIGLGHLLSTALRRNRTDGEYQEDGIATLSVLSSHEGLIAGAVHFCGNCSVWSLPGLEPLLVVISSDPSLPMQPSPPNTCLLTNTSQPYRLTWWRIPPTACINAADNHSVPECNYYMAVLLNDGTFNMIDLKNPETGWFALPERQAAELHLSSHPSFIYNEANSVSDCSQSTTLLFLDHKRVSTHSDSTLTQTDGATYTYDIRAVRLISTTPLGLFGHLIASADYTEAVKLAEKHKFDVELVYQQQWLDLSVTESDFKKFPDLVKSTLALIKNRPFWVMKQCVLFLPSNTIPSSPSSPRDLLAAVRCVLDHGIKVLQMIQDKPEYKDHLGLIKNRLLRQLFHIDCLESIIPAEIFDSSNSKPVLKMISESLKAFRRYSFLVLTLNYAHSGQYEIAKFLMNKLPLTIGQHRLAIVATLPETMDPALYADALLYPSFPPEKEPNGVAQPELEASVLNALYSVSTEDDGEKLKPVTTDDPVEYAKLLSKWVIRRAKQIDTRSGLTSFAVALLRAGQNICQKLISANPKAKQSVGDIEDCLNGLKKSLWDFSELAEVSV